MILVESISQFLWPRNAAYMRGIPQGEMAIIQMSICTGLLGNTRYLVLKRQITWSLQAKRREKILIAQYE